MHGYRLTAAEGDKDGGEHGLLRASAEVTPDFPFTLH